MIVDLFAGPGGWSEGRRAAGLVRPTIGVEFNHDACTTAIHAGHQRIKADVSVLDPLMFPSVDGVIASPPCPPFSRSGLGLGALDMDNVRARIYAFAHGQQPAEVEWNDPRSALCAEPMRWAAALMPRWIACEQVQGALPLWQHTAVRLRELGYSVATGVLSAEQFGVPQVRKRAVLVARRDGLLATLPTPTHQRYGKPVPGLKPFVTMHGAIGWGLTDRPAWTITGGGTRTGGAEFFGNAKCRARLGGRRLTVEEAAVLQGFRPGFVFHGGTAGSRSQQVGDAVPPPLAAAVLDQFADDQRMAVAA